MNVTIGEGKCVAVVGVRGRSRGAGRVLVWHVSTCTLASAISPTVYLIAHDLPGLTMLTFKIQPGSMHVSEGYYTEGRVYLRVTFFRG